MKWTMIHTDNSSMFVNSYGVIHLTMIVMKYDKNNDLIITWRNNGITDWGINKHHIKRDGTHCGGIGND